jgi:large subunit ribosomal protein L10
MKKEILEKKIQEVDELYKKLNKAASIIVFDYHGLTVEQSMDIRKSLRSSGIEVKVYKNNIARRASTLAGFGKLESSLVGAKALAISYKDAVAPAKLLFGFCKKYKQLSLAAGVAEKQVLDQKDVIALANIPTREVLLTQLAVGMLQPVRELAVGLNLINK